MGELVERAEAARLANVSPDTFSAYVTRGQAPAASSHVGRTPLWDVDEISTWLSTRPGRRGRPPGSTSRRPTR